MTAACKMAAHPIADLARAKWRSSGLTDDHARTLGLRPLTREEVQATLGTSDPRPCGVLIPYFDLDGKPTDFFRIRYLENPLGFEGLVEKPQRYVQRGKTLNEVYLPPLLDCPWSEIAEDTNETIYISEGEFKAAAGCSVGLATIGLGGVDLFRATKRGIELLPQLAAIKWENRNVVIVYDSDAATNPNIVRAQNQLAMVLAAKGAMPAVASLPAAPDGSKQGLDDFLVAHGADALEAILRDAPVWNAAVALHEMNEDVLYVMEPPAVLVRDTGRLVDGAKFREMFANRSFRERDGEKTRTVSTPKRWLEWEHRFSVSGMTYAPGRPQFVDGTWNLWPGWGIEPAEGPYQWWLDHLGKLTDPEPPMFHHLLCRFAWMLQHPSEAGYGIFVFSTEKGTGKSSLVFPFTGSDREKITGIFGKNAAILESQHLKGSFNGRLAKKQFILGEEILGDERRERRAYADRLKNFISNPTITINEKFVPAYDVPNLVNYYLTSQHDDGALLETGDRRWAVLHPPEKRLDRAYSSRYFEAMKDPRNIAGLFHHLLSLDIPAYAKRHGISFDREDPPHSRAKLEVIEASQTRLEHWAADLRTHPADVLARVRNLPFTPEQIAKAPLWRLEDLQRVWHEAAPDERNKLDAHTFGRWLKKAGIAAVNKGEKVRPRGGKEFRGVLPFKLYAVRDREAWEGTTEADCWRRWASDFPDILARVKAGARS